MFASGAKRRGCLVVAVLWLAPAAIAQDSFTIKLSMPLSAATNHKGDPVRGAVVTPAALQGDTLQGQITETKTSRAQSIVQFNLVSLLHQGVSVPVAATVTSISNSQGQEGVDEQSHPFTASNPAPAESQAKSRLGSRLGGMLGGAVSEAPNTTAAPAIPGIRVVSQGPGLELAMGATLRLSVQSTGPESLESLAPNAPSATASTPPAAGGSAAAPARRDTAAATSASADQSSQPSTQPELKSVKIDFVPGERTIFFDDFSDMAPDEPPPHWKVRNGPPELKMGGNIRELYSGSTGNSVQLTSPKITVPQNFTFELAWTGEGEMQWIFRDKDGEEAIHATVRGEPDGHTASASVDAKGHLGEGTIQTDTSKPVVFDLCAQQGRVRAYLNGQRLVDVNQVEFNPIQVLEASIGGYRPNGVRSVRIAESAPDFSTVINSAGTYITHGINFDTDSDRLKPESAAVLKQVSAGLIKNPDLKLEIDGYTDSVGDAAHNLDLSKRRAEAVRTVLIAQFGVDASRLTANGFGAGKPLGSNDTPEGRAQNRRVEFVKM
jgi:OmpA-OmpF porin, OOP family